MILHFPATPIRATRPEQIAEAYLAGASDNEMLKRFGVAWRESVRIALRTMNARIARLESRSRRAA